MGMFKSIRCDSKLHTQNGVLQCIGSRPKPGESHTHVGRTNSGLRITWTDKDSKESRAILEREEPFTGWRVWELDKGGYLVSVTSKAIWKGPVLSARGRPYSLIMGDRGPRDSDEVDYGIYCYKTPLLLYGHMRRGIFNMRWPVLGAIELSGHVVEHTKGYRAERATFKKLWYVFDDPHKLLFGDNLKKDLENRYQCDVERLSLDQVEHWADYLTSEMEENDGHW